MKKEIEILLDKLVKKAESKNKSCKRCVYLLNCHYINIMNCYTTDYFSEPANANNLTEKNQAKFCNNLANYCRFYEA